MQDSAEICCDLVGGSAHSDPSEFPRLVSMQAPLLRLAANDATPPALRRLCVDAHVAGVRSAVAMNINSNEAAVAAAVGSLPPWQDVHAALCGGLPAWSDMERVAGAFTAIRAMTALSRFRILGQAMAEKFEDALRPACLLVQQIEPAYAEAVIYADDAGASEEPERVSVQVSVCVCVRLSDRCAFCVFSHGERAVGSISSHSAGGPTRRREPHPEGPTCCQRQRRNAVRHSGAEQGLWCRELKRRLHNSCVVGFARRAGLEQILP